MHRIIGNSSRKKSCWLPSGSSQTTIHYVYDPLKRLTEADYSTGDYYHYGYDAVGNRLTQEKSILGLLTNDTYVYDDANRLTSLNGVTYNWDANGNYAAKWDFAYDDDGVRTTQGYTPYDANGNPQTLVMTRYFFGGSLETSGSSVKKYYSFAGQTIAMKDSTGLKYFLTDHLGSIVGIYDTSNSTFTQQRYLPFGAPRTDVGSITQTDLGYTGQRKLDSGMGGIMDYNARFYSPSINRFLQPDTVIPGAANPQSWNRYSYGANNPIRYNDPDGHCAPLCTAAIGGLIGAAVGAGAYALANRGNSFSWGELGVAALGGAAAGALIGSGLGILGGVATTAAMASTGVSLVSAGTAAVVTGGRYIAQNPNKFESKPFAVNTAISATTAYFTSNPGYNGGAKLLMRLGGAVATYAYNTPEADRDPLDFIPIAAGTLAAHGATEMLGKFMPNLGGTGVLRDGLYPGLGVGSNALRLAATQRLQLGVVKSIVGITNGVVTGALNNAVRNLSKWYIDN